MSEKTYTIGEMARRSGLTVRRVRFYDDAGLLQARRSEAGYRVFSDEDLIRLDLIRALRASGTGLEAIRQVLGQSLPLRDVLTMRLAEVEAQLLAGRRIATVLRVALQEANPTQDHLRRVIAMIDQSHAERRASVAAFFDSVTSGVSFDPRWKETMIALGAPELPESSSAEQIDAWLELCRLFDDRRLHRTLRAQAIDTGRTLGFLRVRDEREAYIARDRAIMAKAAEAIASGLDPLSEDGRMLADEYIGFMAWNRGLEDGPAFRAYIWDVWADADTLRQFWELIDTLNGNESSSSAEYRWLETATIEQLRPRPN